MFEQSINPNTLNDFSQGLYSGQTLSGIGSNRIMLFLYSPHDLPAQVLRSYVYSFTDDFTDAIRTAKDRGTLQSAVDKKQLQSIPGGNTAILPSSEGKVADTQNWNNIWTFTLVMDIQQAAFNGLVSPATRKIASGWIDGEPGHVNEYGNFTLNEYATLVFTHVTNLNVRRNFSSTNTSKDGYSFYPTTMDYAGDSVPMFYNEDMFLGTPSEMLREQYNAPNGIMNYNALSLAHTKTGHPARAISNELKTPKSQLRQIMTALDCGLDQARMDPNAVTDKLRSSVDFRMQPIEVAMNTVIDNLNPSIMYDIVPDIDTSTAISMGVLMQRYPNMEVYPYQIKDRNTFGWDVASQVGQNYSGTIGAIITPKQQFSSMASAVIQSICSALGIATVAFSYRWLDSNGFVMGKNDAFQLSKFSLMVPRPAEEATIIGYMKQYLDDLLFEVIHSCCGEFEINALCDMAGTNLIDLRLYWQPDNQDGAYFQTDAKLGGIINPMVATLGTINSNALSLSNFASNVLGDEFAKQDFPTAPQYM